MRYHLATDNQLTHIFNYEKDCPADILSGVVREMINRNMLNGYIIYAMESVKIIGEKEDLLQIGLIELHKQIGKFKPGKTTPKTFAIHCLRNKFMKVIEEQTSLKRAANYNQIVGEELDDFLIQAPINIERYVINKMEVKYYLSCLKEKERVAILMQSFGYKLDEIAKEIGFAHARNVSKLLQKARNRIREELGYENQIHNKQIS
jgi:RNA polymerase sigma factor (sigma-70 family)